MRSAGVVRGLAFSWHQESELYHPLLRIYPIILMVVHDELLKYRHIISWIVDLLCTTGDDYSCRLWDVSTGQETLTTPWRLGSPGTSVRWHFTSVHVDNRALWRDIVDKLYSQKSSTPWCLHFWDVQMESKEREHRDGGRGRRKDRIIWYKDRMSSGHHTCRDPDPGRRLVSGISIYVYQYIASIIYFYMVIFQEHHYDKMNYIYLYGHSVHWLETS